MCVCVCVRARERVGGGFQRRRDFPNTLGAVDGKHIRIRCPDTDAYHYKNYYSVVLLAAVDSDYRFLCVDVGSEGRASDSTIWKESDFYQDICSEENKPNLPPPKKLPGAKDRLPYYFVGDDAFALREHIMERFPSMSAVYAERVYNYRLSRARRVVDNAFGMLANSYCSTQTTNTTNRYELINFRIRS